MSKALSNLVVPQNKTSDPISANHAVSKRHDGNECEVSATAPNKHGRLSPLRNLGQSVTIEWSIPARLILNLML